MIGCSALDKLEGAGFAHHSHTEDETKADSASEPRAEIVANVLN